MKKLFTLIIGLMAALGTQAQGFEFQFHGQSLAEGETVVIAAEEDIFGELSCETNNMMDPTDGLMLKRLGGIATNATATLQITHNSLEQAFLQWCMGGECTPLGSRTFLTKQFAVMSETQVQFDATGIQSEGYLMATLKVTVGLESHSVRILFVNGDIDVDGIKALPQVESAKGAVYDLSGSQIVNCKLSNCKLPGGIYIVNDGTHIRKTFIK